MFCRSRTSLNYGSSPVYGASVVHRVRWNQLIVFGNSRAHSLPSAMNGWAGEDDRVMWLDIQSSLIPHTVMSLLEAPCAKTSWRALLFRTIMGITGALIVCFDNWWFKQANNSETCFGGHHCDFEQHVPCLAVYVCMNSEWSSYLRRPALLFCVGATIPWQCADSFGGRFY